MRAESIYRDPVREQTNAFVALSGARQREQSRRFAVKHVVIVTGVLLVLTALWAMHRG